MATERQKIQQLELRILELEAEIRRRDEHHVCPRIPNPGEYAIELVKALEMHAFPPRWVVGADWLGDSQPSIYDALRGPLRVVPVADDEDMIAFATGNYGAGLSAAHLEQYEAPVREKVEAKQRQFAATIGTAIHEIMLSMPPLLKDGDEVMLTDADGDTWHCVVDATSGDGQSGSLRYIEKPEGDVPA